MKIYLFFFIVVVVIVIGCKTDGSNHNESVAENETFQKDTASINEIVRNVSA